MTEEAAYSVYVDGIDGQQFLFKDVTAGFIDEWLDGNELNEGRQIKIWSHRTERVWTLMEWRESRPVEKNEPDPLQYLTELGAIAHKNFEVRNIVMQAISASIRNVADENKNDRRKAMTLGQIVEDTATKIIELFE